MRTYIKTILTVYWFVGLGYMLLINSFFGFGLIDIYTIPITMFEGSLNDYISVILIYGPPIVTAIYFLATIKRFR